MRKIKNLYSKSAVEAVKLYRENKVRPLHKAWEQAVQQFTDSPSSQIKACPRDTFLGLSKEGLIVGIPPEDYTDSEKNKGYAMRAIELLQNDERLAENPIELWKKVMSGIDKKHNAQMDVVIGLWQEELIRH